MRSIDAEVPTWIFIIFYFLFHQLHNCLGKIKNDRIVLKQINNNIGDFINKVNLKKVIDFQ